jgi:hypothetical protein
MGELENVGCFHRQPKLLRVCNSLLNECGLLVVAIEGRIGSNIQIVESIHERMVGRTVGLLHGKLVVGCGVEYACMLLQLWCEVEVVGLGTRDRNRSSASHVWPHVSFLENLHCSRDCDGESDEEPLGMLLESGDCRKTEALRRNPVVVELGSMNKLRTGLVGMEKMVVRTACLRFVETMNVFCKFCGRVMRGKGRLLPFVCKCLFSRAV